MNILIRQYQDYDSYEDEVEDEDDDDEDEDVVNTDTSFCDHLTDILMGVLVSVVVAWDALGSVRLDPNIDVVDDEEDEDYDEDDDYEDEPIKETKEVLYEPRRARKEYWRKINLRDRRRVYYR
jgi:hypothetical protein